MEELLECEGYKKLLSAVERDETQDRAHDYRGKLDWILDRAKHYAEKTGLSAVEVLDGWEKARSYWYMNYYQESNQPTINVGKVRIFETVEDLAMALGKNGFRCPVCGGVSLSPYNCTSGKEMSKGKVCDWNVGGLLKDLGKGVYVYVKKEVRGQTIFMPIDWE